MSGQLSAMRRPIFKLAFGLSVTAHPLGAAAACQDSG